MVDRRRSSIRKTIAAVFRPKAAASRSGRDAPKSTLHNLPPEVRELIFRPLCVCWNGKIPPLIKALRPDKKLYGEALDIFFKNNTFVFHAGNGWSFGDMMSEAVLSIQKVKIVVAQGIMECGLWKIGVSKEDQTVLTPFVPATLADAENIREVTLEFPARNGNATSAFAFHGGMHYHFNYFLRFEKMVKVTLLTPGRVHDVNTYIGSQRNYSVSKSIRMGNSRLGTIAKLATVPAYHLEDDDEGVPVGTPVESQDVWFWEAEEGRYLDQARPPPPPYC